MSLRFKKFCCRAFSSLICGWVKVLHDRAWFSLVQADLNLSMASEFGFHSHVPVQQCKFNVVNSCNFTKLGDCGGGAMAFAALTVEHT